MRDAGMAEQAMSFPGFRAYIRPLFLMGRPVPLDVPLRRSERPGPLDDLVPRCSRTARRR